MWCRPADTAGLLRELLLAVASRDYRGCSLTIWMFEHHWSVGVDGGHEVDDDVDWWGVDLIELLQLTLAGVLAMPTAPAEEAVLQRLQDEDLDRLLALLRGVRHRLSSYPLDLAYIPYSEVEPDRPWELGLEIDGKAQIWPGVGAAPMLSEALGQG